MEIKLNDILRLTNEEIARTKVRLNADYDGEDAVEIYRRDPERVKKTWGQTLRLRRQFAQYSPVIREECDISKWTLWGQTLWGQTPNFSNQYFALDFIAGN